MSTNALSKSRTKVPHRTRPMIAGQAAHVSMHLVPGLPTLRSSGPCGLIMGAIRASQGRFDCNVVQYAVLSYHLHLVVEAPGREKLAQAMKGLKVSVARRLNRLWGQSGTVFDDRYHARVLDTLAKLKRGYRYVLSNARKHGVPLQPGEIDPYSSGPWYAYGSERDGQPLAAEGSPVASPQTILLWMVQSLLTFGIDEVPGAKAWGPRRTLEELEARLEVPSRSRPPAQAAFAWS